MELLRLALAESFNHVIPIFVAVIGLLLQEGSCSQSTTREPPATLHRSGKGYVPLVDM